MDWYDQIPNQKAAKAANPDGSRIGPPPDYVRISPYFGIDRPTVIGGVYPVPYVPYYPNLISGYTDGGAGLPGMVVSPNGTSYQSVVQQYGYNGLAGGGSQYDGGIYGTPGVRYTPAVPGGYVQNQVENLPPPFKPTPVAVPTPTRPATWNGPVGVPSAPDKRGMPY